MKITQDVRDYARKKEVEQMEALELGLKEKAKEFESRGSKLYV